MRILYIDLYINRNNVGLSWEIRMIYVQFHLLASFHCDIISFHIHTALFVVTYYRGTRSNISVQNKLAVGTYYSHSNMSVRIISNDIVHRV